MKLKLKYNKNNNCSYYKNNETKKLAKSLYDWFCVFVLVSYVVFVFFLAFLAGGFLLELAPKNEYNGVLKLAIVIFTFPFLFGISVIACSAGCSILRIFLGKE